MTEHDGVKTDLTATDELRRLLDERGVKWDATIGAADTIWTHWDAFNGHRVYAMDNGDGTVEIFGEWDVSPEQAIAATLGRRTCHKVRVHMQIEDEMHCSECGRFLGFAGDAGAPPYYFCPNCGRKVVDE